MMTQNVAMLIAKLPEGTFEFSDKFLKFIYQDEMEGISDLYAMTKYKRTAERIPEDIRKEFESHLDVADKLLDTTAAELQKLLDKLNFAEKNGDPEVVLDSLTVFGDPLGLLVTNVLSVESPLFYAFKEGVEGQKDFCMQKSKQQKVDIVDDAIKQFLAKEDAEKAAKEAAEEPLAE